MASRLTRLHGFPFVKKSARPNARMLHCSKRTIRKPYRKDSCVIFGLHFAPSQDVPSVCNSKHSFGFREPMRIWFRVLYALWYGPIHSQVQVCHTILVFRMWTKKTHTIRCIFETGPRTEARPIDFQIINSCIYICI